MAAEETRKELQAELDALRRQLDCAVNANPDGIMVVGTDGVVKFANPAAELVFGKRAQEMVGDPFGYDLFAGERAQLEVARWDGHRATVEMRVVGTEWDGAPAYVAALRDVTERRRTEDWLRAEAERRAHAETLHNTAILMAQYVRNLITPIMGWAELRAKGRFEDAEQLTKVAMENGQKVAAVIDALIEISEAGPPPGQASQTLERPTMSEMDIALRTRLQYPGEPPAGLPS